MLVVILGLPLSLISIKVFFLIHSRIREKFPYKVGGRTGTDIKNYLLSLIMSFFLIGIFVFIPLMYFGFFIYQFMELITNFQFTIWMIVIFSILQVFYLRYRSYIELFLFQILYVEIVRLNTIEGKESNEDNVKKKFRTIYLLGMDIIIFPIYFILISNYAGLYIDKII